MIKAAIGLQLCLLLSYLNIDNFGVSQTPREDCVYYKQCANATFNSTIDCLECFGSKSCISSTIYIKDMSGVQCLGDSSCMNALIKFKMSEIDIAYDTFSGAAVMCYGYNSCFNGVSFELYDDLNCDGSLACTNINKITFGYNAGGMGCGGLYSCINNYIKSDSSWSPSEFKNYRTITVQTFGTFDLYNSTIVSNNNNIVLSLFGYYSGYGLTFECDTNFDTCHIECIGLSCMNLNCIGNNCMKTCLDNNDQLCLNTKDIIVQNTNGYMYDYMANLLNKILENEYNFSIFPTSKNNDNIKYIDVANSNNNICQIKILNGSYSNTQDTPDTIVTNGSICCLAFDSCHVSTSLTSINDSIYCNSCQTCQYLTLSSGNNIYCNGESSCQYSKIQYFKNVLSCNGRAACIEATIKNGNMY